MNRIANILVVAMLLVLALATERACAKWEQHQTEVEQ